ncbi:MAG: hypothetical protein L0Z50_04385 [Verrucomicrobiales bacterium]|nr:hypothetical protein [Verrucomicrobiales bacterium]
MAFSLAWLDQNWFTLLQSAGIIGSLWLTGATVRRDARARRVSNILALSEQHRDLWGEVHRRPELSRILSKEVDLIAQPISTSEEEFLNLVIVHFRTGWLLAMEESINRLDAIRSDVLSFFSLPLPRCVWEQTKHARDKDFVDFIDSCFAVPVDT